MTGTAALLEALATFLRDEVQGDLAPERVYQGRIAQNLLGLLAREARFGTLLGELDRSFAREHGLDPEAMPAVLSRALRDGGAPAPAVVSDYLKRRVLLTEAINNPRYPGLALARKAWPEHDALIQSTLHPRDNR